MEKIYRAFDGKEFKDEEECEIYEFSKKNLPKLKGSLFYDCKGRQIDLKTPSDIDNIYAIKFSNLEALCFFDEFSKEWGVPPILRFKRTMSTLSPTELEWIWSEAADEWVSIKKITHNIDALKEAIGAIFEEDGCNYMHNIENFLEDADCILTDERL